VTTQPPALATPATPKHGLAAGADAARARGRADWTIDQAWARDTAAEHATWKTLLERQTKLLPGLACDAFIQGMAALPIAADQIPDFRRLSEALMRRTGWQVRHRRAGRAAEPGADRLCTAVPARVGPAGVGAGRGAGR